MAYDIGTARGVIEMEYNGRGVDDAIADQEKLEKSGQTTQQALGKVGKTAGIAGAAIAGGLALAVHAAANFEQRMSAVEAVSGATEAQMGKLSDKALQLGKDTAFSATDAASAIEELVKAGVSVPDVLNGAADSVVALAAAGEIDLPQAATIAANSMNQFNLAADDMVNVADKIAGAANASAIDVGDFGQSLQQVGAVANLAGVSFDDTATAIAIMGNAGIKGSDAGTSLKSMFQRLQPVTKKQIDLFKELGLITKDGSNQFYDQQGNLKDLSKVAGTLQKSLKGMTAQQKQAALNTLFGSDAIRAAAILSNAGAKGFDKMAQSIDKTKAADVAAKRMDNFNGKLEQAKGSLETAGITIGNVLLPYVTKLVDAVTGALNAFLGLSDGMQTFIALTAAGASGFLLLVAAIIKIVQVIKTVQETLAVLRIAMASTWVAALGPIALIIAAIAVVIAIIILLWKKNETFRNIVLAVWHAIQAAISAVVDWFQGVPGMFQDAWDAIKSAFATGLAWIKSHWRLLIAIILGPLGIAIALVTKFWPQITAAFQAGIDFILGIWQAFWNTFGGIITAAWGVVTALITLGWTIIKGVFILYMRLLASIFTAGWNLLIGIVTAVWNTIKAIVRGGINLVAAVVRTYLGIIKAVFTTVWNAIMGVLRAVWARIGGTVTSGANHALSVIQGVWNAVKGATTAAWNAVVGTIRSVVGKIGDVVGTIKDKVIDALSGAATWLFDKGAEIIQGLIDGITSKLDAVGDAIGKVTDKVGKFLPGSPVKEGPLKKLNHGKAGGNIVQMIIDGIIDMSDPLTAALSDAMPTLDAPGYASPSPDVRGKVRGKRGGTGKGGLRLVRGELSIDKRGRAFITGVATSAVDDDDDYDDTLGRMGR